MFEDNKDSIRTISLPKKSFEKILTTGVMSHRVGVEGGRSSKSSKIEYLAKV